MSGDAPHTCDVPGCNYEDREPVTKARVPRGWARVSLPNAHDEHDELQVCPRHVGALTHLLSGARGWPAEHAHMRCTLHPVGPLPAVCRACVAALEWFSSRGFEVIR